MIHTNRCKHCNKTKEEHLFTFSPTGECDSTSGKYFTDSGLAALDAHKEELYEISMEIDATYYDKGDTHVAIPITIFKKLQRILNQIEKEK